MAQDLLSVKKKRHSKVNHFVCVSAQQLEGQTSSGPAQKVPLLSLNLLFYFSLQPLEATHPNTAGHAPSHRPFELVFMQEGGSRVAQCSLWLL